MALGGFALPYARDLSCQVLWSNWYTKGHEGEPKGIIMLWVKALGIWLVMLLVAFLNGALRELLIARLMEEQRTHVLSVCLLSGGIFGPESALRRKTPHCQRHTPVVAR